MQKPEKSLIETRYAAFKAATPKLSAQGLLALHAQLLGACYEKTGQIRDADLSWDGLYFAYPSLIMGSLKHRFEALGKIDSLKSLSRDSFFDALAYHISELHAISPFRIGNRCTIALHAEQIANAVGYAINSCTTHKHLWDEALAVAFAHSDHSAITCLLKGAPIPVDVFPQSLMGPSGLPTLPDRDASLERRYLRTIDRVRQILEDYIHDAREEATAALIALTKSGAPASERAVASHELGFLRHPKGPLFQAALLSAIKYGPITPVSHDRQTPLERVREVSVAITAAINQQPRANLAYLIETLHVPTYIGGGSPHQDRLAAQFLKATPEQNYADPRFAACQRAVEESVAKSRQARKTDLERMAAHYDRASRAVAARIRVGDMMTTHIDRATSKRIKEVG
jgi:cell filamentation protein